MDLVLACSDDQPATRDGFRSAFEKEFEIFAKSFDATSSQGSRCLIRGIGAHDDFLADHRGTIPVTIEKRRRTVGEECVVVALECPQEAYQDPGL
ncbi:MAG: hypothetical protein ABIF09_09945 [Gemmatimonadota bacterium]